MEASMPHEPKGVAVAIALTDDSAPDAIEPVLQPAAPAGLRLPVATGSGSSPEVGLTADLARWDAFVQDAIVLRIAPHYGRIPQDGPGFDLRFVSEIWLPDTFAGDPEFFAVYGGQFLFRSEKTRAGVGLTGRWWTTRGGSFGESALHGIEGNVALSKGSFRPGAVVRFPIDDWDESLDVAIGLTLDVML